MNMQLSKLLPGLLLALQLLSAQAQTAPTLLSPQPAQLQAAHLSADVLSRYHYTHQKIDSTLSGKIFDQYLNSLDPQRLFFVQSDVDQMAADRAQLVDGIWHEDLSLPFAMYNLYAQRAHGCYQFARSLLKQGFDFNRQESYQFSREQQPWPHSADELSALWRQRVKNDWLRLRLAGENDAHIAAILDKRYARVQLELAKTKSADAFEVFMNAVTMTLDPHTNYMAPRSAEDFAIGMRLSLVGIGAAMAEKDGYNTIGELVPGGPAQSSGQIGIGDRIVGVAQGEGRAMTSVLGMREDEAVALIRGVEGSPVVLDILPANAPANGAHKKVTLTRKKVELQDAAASKSVITLADGFQTRHIGVIALPGFYRDFAGQQKDEPNFKSASKDVARLLDELKADKVDGVLLDLRNNGGGSLAEAVEVTALFNGGGPVVQQRDAEGKVQVDKAFDDAPVHWDGPTGVLINRNSASASEIFAAAMQDYGRGIVIGERSYGKGTVQTGVDLDQLVESPGPKLGELKMTIAQFFRINGNTTQLLGVQPDINLLPWRDGERHGEAKFANALAPNHIEPAQYVAHTELKTVLPALAQRSQTRLAANSAFAQWRQASLQDDAVLKKNLISLNENERRQQRAAQQAAFDAGTSSSAPEDGLAPAERSLATDLATQQRLKRAPDVLLDEAAHIVSDEAALLPASSAIARAAAGAESAAIQRRASTWPW